MTVTVLDRSRRCLNRGLPRPGRSLAALLGASAALLAAASSCDEDGPRVYTAQRHSLEAGCLETYAPIGLVRAREVSSQCAPVCLLIGEDRYVSSVCLPYPSETSLEPEDSEGCAAALAAPSCGDLAESPDAAAP